MELPLFLKFKNPYLKILGAFLGLGFFLFILSRIIAEGGFLKYYRLIKNPIYLFPSLILLILMLLIQAFIWHYILSFSSLRKIKIIISLKSWTYSIIGKYLPGGVWMPGARLYLSTRNGVALPKVFSSLLLEQFYFFSLLFFWIFVLNSYYSYKIGSYVLLFLAFIFLIISPYIFQFLNKRFKLQDFPLTHKFGFLLFSLYSFSILLLSLSFIFFHNAFYKPAGFLFTINSLLTSYFIGFIVFFVPAGIGIRETMLSYLLAKKIPYFYAGVIALGFRFMLILAEFSFVTVIMLFSKFIKGKLSSDKKKKPHLTGFTPLEIKEKGL
jgi:hypothetical protein